MARPKILDTTVLINHWRKFDQPQRTTTECRLYAEELIELQGTNVIVSPVLIEFLAGARNRSELELFQAYLEPFEVLDNGLIPPADWDEARRFAQWIRTDRNRTERPRKLGDCLIQAIAARFNRDVVSSDLDIKRRVPPR